MQELSHNKENMRPVRRIITRFLMIENLYMKFILTVIAITLIIISIELADRNRYCAVDIFHGSIKIDGAVKVSGEMDTYEQNNVISRRFHP